MGRRLRFHPPGSLVEVTCRTVHGRLLLKPTPEIAELCRGALARATRLYPVRIHAFVFLGNHYHLLLSAPDASRVAAFMHWLNSNLAREIGRVVGWREKFWGRRYQAILVSGEEAAQVERLRYILAHGCKENLVRRPAEWPGATSVRNLLSGNPVAGRWPARSNLDRLARRRRRVDARGPFSQETLELAPIPCWSRLGPVSYRKRIADLVREIEQETERRIRQSGIEPFGVESILHQEPHRAPSGCKRGPAPLIHAASRAVRSAVQEAYRNFVAAFRRASKNLRTGPLFERALELFPLGCIPVLSPRYATDRAPPT